MLITCIVNAQTISGKITGDNARPVPDAFIYLLNTNISTLSDADGNFSLKNISAGTYFENRFLVSELGLRSLSQGRCRSFPTA